MAFSDEFLEELRSRADILEIVSSYLDVRLKGRNYMGLCPFHSEKTPSFCVYIDTNSFYCFGCGLGGDVISFVMLMEKMQYKEAVEFLANRVGMQISENFLGGDYSNRKIIYEINRLAAKFYHNNLMGRDNPGIRYFESRGLSRRIIRHFGLGYSTDNFSLIDYLKKRGFSDDNILKSNVGVKSRVCLSDRFSKRVIFPIIDVKGNVIAFGARALDNSTPKYLNTSDTPVFRKSDNLFALNFARKEKYLILTEGYMDVIALHQLGFNSAVASLGTSLTLGQAKLISRYTNEVYLCYDSDEAGKKATERAIRILEREDLNLKIVKIDDAKDPDEFIRLNRDKSKIKFKCLIEKSKDKVDFKIAEMKKNFDLESSADKFRFLDHVAKIVSEISDPLEREVYSSKICSKYHILKDVFDLKVKQNYSNKKKEKFVAIKRQKTFDKLNNLCIEDFFISYIMKNVGFLKYTDNFTEKDFSKNVSFKVLERIRFLMSSGQSVNLSSILEGFDIKGAGEISRIFNLDVTEVNFFDCLNFLETNRKIRDFRSSEDLNEKEISEFLDKLKNDKI